MYDKWSITKKVPATVVGNTAQWIASVAGLYNSKDCDYAMWFFIDYQCASCALSLNSPVNVLQLEEQNGMFWATFY